ncbi:hypothetical protein [Pelosinus sp. IPA-1]|uniref:hypothetical protein n=1 Tax=Pelosinus sp. IPA-1 TaxID=3029569 RepID=UPI0025526EFA|nr:hypothetical protein [Pelosinus sp. IPA-1]
MAPTYMLDDGVDLRTVAGKLGHASTNTTTTIYSHLLKSAETKTAGIMENRLTNLKNITIDKNKKQAQ